MEYESTHLCCLFIRRAGSLCGVFDKVVFDDVTLLAVLVAHGAAHHVDWGRTGDEGKKTGQVLVS